MAQIHLLGFIIKFCRKSWHPADVKYTHVAVIKQTVFMANVIILKSRFFVARLQVVKAF